MTGWSHTNRSPLSLRSRGSLSGVFFALSLLPSSAHSAPEREAKLLTFSQGAAHFSVSEPVSKTASISDTFRISTDSLQVQDIFMINNPLRVVIDVNKFKGGKTKEYQVKGSNYIEKVRTGVHPDKLRFVLDISSSTDPKLDTQIGKSELIVRLLPQSSKVDSEVSTSEVTKKDSPEPPKEENLEGVSIVAARRLSPPKKPLPPVIEVAEKKEEKPILKDKVEAAKDSTQPTQRPSEKIALAKATQKEKKPVQKAPTPKPKKVVKKKIEKEPMGEALKETESEESLAGKKTDEIFANRTQQLDGIRFYFHGEEKTPLIKFSLSQKPSFRLEQKSPRLYQLVLPKSRLKWNYLELPQFPPQDFRGFSMVLVEPKGTELRVSIGVERGVKLMAFTKGSELWVKKR